MIKGKINCASIVHVNGGDSVKVFITKTDNHEKEVNESFYLPKYDMSRVSIPDFLPSNDTDASHRIYKKILLSKEGREVLNDLKNERTNTILNNCLTLEIDKMPIKIVNNEIRSSNLRTFIQKLINCPLSEKNNVTNLLAFKSIGLTKKDIWQRFLEKGLVEKYKTV